MKNSAFEYIAIPKLHPCWEIFQKHKLLGRCVYIPKYWSRRFSFEEIEKLQNFGLTGKVVYVCKAMWNGTKLKEAINQQGES